MNAKELAEKLNGREYGEEISDAECVEAQKCGLVVVFGASDDLMEFRGALSDDLMEFRGALYDEVGACGGGEAMMDKYGILPDRNSIEDDEELEEYFKRKKTAKMIKAVWHSAAGEYAWTFETEIPHSTFDIVEGSEKYCRGIVFSIQDL